MVCCVFDVCVLRVCRLLFAGWLLCVAWCVFVACVVCVCLLFGVCCLIVVSWLQIV